MNGYQFSAEVPQLLQSHFDVLTKASGIAVDVIRERAYSSAPTWQELNGKGFKGYQKRLQCFPAMVIPNYAPDGSLTHHVVRWDRPHIKQNGDVVKYEQPAGWGLRLDVPPRCRAELINPHSNADIWWTEGAKKADCLASHGLIAVNTPGVQGWRSTSAITDLFGIPFKGRKVILAYDSDAMEKLSVYQAVLAIGRYLEHKGAIVEVIDWQQAGLPTGDKVGVDDFLAG